MDLRDRYVVIDNILFLQFLVFFFVCFALLLIKAFRVYFRYSDIVVSV